MLKYLQFQKVGSKEIFDILIRPISDIVGSEVIDLKAANGSEIPYLGFVELNLKLTSADISNSTETLRVPFLVTGTDQESSVIIRFNVLEEIITESDGNKDLKKISINSVPTLKSSKVGAFVNLIETKQQQNEDLASVKICSKKDIILPKGSMSQIICKTNISGVVDSPLPVMFEPDSDISLPEELQMSESLLYIKPGACSSLKIPIQNPTDHNIVLPRRTLIGRLKSVSAVVPLPNANCKLPNSQNSMQEYSSEKVQQSAAEVESDNWLPPVDLTHLEPEQRAIVEKMLTEENAAFARDDNDIGSAEDLQMKIKLKDTIPVQRTYTSIPKPLYKEVREHIEDMLVKGWIRISKSAYSSPLVCI